MPLYRSLNLTDNTILYVTAGNKAQARSHVARKVIQVEVATPTQMIEDAAAMISLAPEQAVTE